MQDFGRVHAGRTGGVGLSPERGRRDTARMQANDMQTRVQATRIGIRFFHETFLVQLSNPRELTVVWERDEQRRSIDSARRCER